MWFAARRFEDNHAMVDLIVSADALRAADDTARDMDVAGSMAEYVQSYPREFIQDMLAGIDTADKAVQAAPIGENTTAYSFELGSAVVNALTPRQAIDPDIHRITLSLFTVPESFDWTLPDSAQAYEEFRGRLAACTRLLCRVTLEPPSLA